MLSLVSKLLFAVAGLAVAVAIAYAAVVDERAGTMLLVFLALAAGTAAVATAGSAVPDEAPVVSGDAPPPERRATTTGSPPRGTAWPFTAAVATGGLAASAAAGGKVVGVGVLAVVAAAAGWFGKVWKEDPSWTPRLKERVATRFLVPVGLPVGMFLLAALIAVNFSRILLAIDKEAAVAVALVVAVAILGACAWVAARPRISSTAVIALAVVGVVSTAGAGVTGVAAGEREFHHAGEEHEPIKVVAKETKFDKDKITVRAGEEVEIEFENADGGVYHNIAVYEGDGPDAPPVFNGEGFPGDGDRTYHFKAPAPGAYVFVCDFHPNMKGAFVTEAA